MTYVIIGVIVFIIVIALICVFLVMFYRNKYNFLYIKINEADNNLDIMLQKKEEILFKIVPILEKAKIEDIPEENKKKSQKMDHYKLYEELSTMANDILKLIDEYEDKLDFKELDSLIELLNINENDINAAIKYYNDNGEEVNYLAHKFPANIIKALSHYQDINLYKLQKREKIGI